jgi:hypothetical protein
LADIHTPTVEGDGVGFIIGHNDTDDCDDILGRWWVGVCMGGMSFVVELGVGVFFEVTVNAMVCFVVCRHTKASDR